MVAYKASSSFRDWAAAARVLKAWRECGSNAADSILSDEIQVQPDGLLLKELHHRLHGVPGPRLLIDGCWLSRPYGGISRVWKQILATFQLPGLINEEAPVALIDRNTKFTTTNSFTLGKKLIRLILRQWPNCPKKTAVWFGNGRPMCSVRVGSVTLDLIAQHVPNSLWCMTACQNVFGLINQN